MPRTQSALLLVVPLGLVLAGCFGGGSGQGRGGQPASDLEFRNMQTRTYDTADTALVIKATMNVLQDLGYVVKNVDKDLGFLAAEKWTNIAHTKREVRKAKKTGATLAATQVFECTANITAHAGGCRVRVNFQRKILDSSGAVLDAHVVDDAAFYQLFHSRVAKGVFLQQEGV
ncbi:MAG: hypothetical protein JXR94_17410 [Candidatus Hydrogenedentes bacterium]|nr:hypothetical protein [Candidatus Hydrogenedentota bacterium]